MQKGQKPRFEINKKSLWKDATNKATELGYDLNKLVKLRNELPEGSKERQVIQDKINEAYGYKEGGQLPIWELAGNYTGCMIGYHAIPVIVDAYIKGIREYDVQYLCII